jgi:hypothetical protein
MQNLCDRLTAFTTIPEKFQRFAAMIIWLAASRASAAWKIVLV